MRTVWRVSTKPYSGAHFAVWPPELVEVMIKAGTSEKGCCPACGAPWSRVVKCPERPGVGLEVGDNKRDGGLHNEHGIERTGMSHHKYDEWKRAHPNQTSGWEPTCKCFTNDGTGRCVVLDPFSGSATTGMVALKMGRDYIGIDLNPEYLPLAQARVLDNPAPTGPTEVPDEGSIFDLFSKT